MTGELRKPLRGALAALVCAALLAPHPAVADQRKDKKTAESHKDQGKAFFRVELYDKAIDEFKKAYDLNSEAGLLFNIGRCYEKINDKQNALKYYLDYLATAPADVTEVNARVELLRRQIELEKGTLDQRQEEDARRKKAADHVTAATRLLGERQYDAAISEYSSAYQLTRDPEILYLTAEAYRGKGDKAQAVVEYRRYLDQAPSGTNAARAIELRTTLEAEIGAERGRTAQDKAAEENRVDSKHDLKPETGPQPAQPEGGTVPTGPQDDRARSGRVLKLTGLIAAGTGGALLGLGIVFASSASSKSSEIEDAPFWSQELQDTYDSGKSSARNATICLIVGTGAVAAGGVLYYFGLRKEREAAGVAVAPVVTDDTVGFAIGGGF